MTHDRNIDLHLLACLDALLTERQVTRAAERMNMTQPGMSNALARLRQKFQDELLVRTSHGMVPTERALELAASVKAALMHVDAALSHQSEFTPEKARFTYKIAISDYVSLLLMPALMNDLLKEAPAVKVTTSASDAKRLREWLEEGECQLSIGYYTDLADGMHSSELLTDEMCCIAREGHPSLRGHISLEQYIEQPHVLMVGGSQAATFEVMADEALRALGLARRIVMRLPSLLVVPAVVAGSDMIATVPRRLARICRESLPLQVMELPVEVPTYRLLMVWHERTQHDGAQRWLRQKIRHLAQGLHAASRVPKQTAAPSDREAIGVRRSGRQRLGEPLR
jgi:DNA-binding transcriptional LysR family regulator